MIHIAITGGEPVVEICAGECCLYSFEYKYSVHYIEICSGVEKNRGEGKFACQVALGAYCLRGNYSYIHLYGLMSIMTSIAKKELTGLDDQNTKQAPVPEITQKLVLKSGGCLDNGEKEEFNTRTSGAVLRRSVRIPGQRKDLGHNDTHIRAMCGGIGGNVAMVGIEKWRTR